MATVRFRALDQAYKREAVKVIPPSVKTSDYFGVNVFDLPTMRKYLSKEAYNSVLKAIDKGESIDRKMAGQVAAGMKAWAMSRGANHYTHWFQPLTDATAEKHDAFLCIDPKDGSPFENFDGKLLAQQEPDASSLPSGGIRNTFEARGYTAWDPSSPAFVLGTTLCIPTIFISYKGEALDYKTPLLRALNSVDKAAVSVCNYFDKNVRKVISTLGCEQEFFLIDEALYYARPDLSLTHRTLMGHSSAKDQQLEDHYFGAIPERASAFIQDLEIEGYKVGIPIKTRHNEVAPNQFEVAPIFEEANLATDHNILLMDVMRRVARRHRFKVLLHEKPFAGVNGSGKHNNWSLATDTGVNLLSPGNTPKSNLQFLTFLVNTIKAVHENADLLRASVVSAGNQHRLGANEAPPAIMSVFLGSQISKMLDAIENRVSDRKMSPYEKTELKLDIGRIPEILLDNTDRNRTSPFAFTGNRFEFRAVGSAENCASAITIINAAVAYQLGEFKKDTDRIINKGVKKDEAILQVLRKYITLSKPIRFDKNNYSDEWKKEAERRGLTNISDVPEALKAYVSDKSIKLFEKTNVFSEREIYARYEVKLEMYSKKIQIESRVLGDLAVNHIIPTAIKYQSELIDNVEGLYKIFGDDAKEIGEANIRNIKDISIHISEIKKNTDKMIEARKKANNKDDRASIAAAYSQEVYPFLDKIRYHIDKLELMVNNEIWPLPKYRELLFTR